MKVYSYSEARQQLAELLNRARREGEVEIRRRDGQVFVVRPTAGAGSPLDVPGVNTDLSRQEIVGLVRESRRSTERFLKETSSPNRLQPTRRGRGRLNRSR
jgi:prevent-host-death family protein